MTGATVTRTDDQIQHDVLEEFSWDARVQPNEIGVTVKDGVVALTGWVDNYGKKWTAERTAHRVNGVRAVANDIEVRLPSSAERTDADIAGAATRALEWDAFVPIERLDVTVARGWVTIKGEVEWEYQRRSAERAVRRLSGVRGVTNLAAVKPRVQPTTQELRQRIEDALNRNAETNAEQVNVDVESDKVILRGSVHSWVEKQEAERVAWSAPGVTSVDNRIAVTL
ncbi:BON domain-containing protein [Rugosimonospora africana]|uniref:Ornithine aminotransferase n=1 Tax=Rugosimonospora africana TaxID=556532 RepID=A0A8J3QV98_9ACTN|nr:BON domain-containing protein [Rugosimonospora africana]GIH16418.1 ornithine aminotransferase [Rugosimonospora africana]